MRTPDARVLVLLTAVFVLGGLVFAVGIPLFQGADESSHVDRLRLHAYDPFDLPGPDERIDQAIRAAVEHVGLSEAGDPRFDRIAADRPDYLPFREYPDAAADASVCYFNCQSYQYAHPPLYYVAFAPIARAFEAAPFPIEVFALRVAGVLVAAPVVVLTWWTGVQVWGRRSLLPLAAAAVVATFGPVVADAATVNNNGLTVVLGAAAVALAAQVARHGADLRSSALLGIVVALGLLTKGQFLAIAPVAGLAVVAAPPRSVRADARTANTVTNTVANRVANAVAFAVPAVLGAAWWLGNLVRDGSLTPGGSEILPPDRPGPWTTTSFPVFAVEQAGRLAQRFWGSIGDAHGEVPDWANALLAVGVALLAVGWAVARDWRRRRPTRSGTRTCLILAAFPAVLAVAALYASYEVWRPTGEVRGLAGRYLYPVVPALAVGFVAAVTAIARRTVRSVPPPALLAAGIVAAALLGTGESAARTFADLYRTADIGELADRALVVAPVPDAPVWLVATAVAWAAAVAAAAVTATRLPRPGRVGDEALG